MKNDHSGALFVAFMTVVLIVLLYPLWKTIWQIITEGCYDPLCN